MSNDDLYIMATVTVSPTFLPALEAVSEELERRHPKSTAAQRLDMVFQAGIVEYVRNLGIEVKA